MGFFIIAPYEWGLSRTASNYSGSDILDRRAPPPHNSDVITTTLLAPEHAAAYRDLMLEAYAQEPDAFTSTPEERAVLPMSWWEKRLGDNDDSLVLGALEDGKLVGAVG